MWYLVVMKDLFLADYQYYFWQSIAEYGVSIFTLANCFPVRSADPRFITVVWIWLDLKASSLCQEKFFQPSPPNLCKENLLGSCGRLDVSLKVGHVLMAVLNRTNIFWPNLTKYLYDEYLKKFAKYGHTFVYIIRLRRALTPLESQNSTRSPTADHAKFG